MVSDIFGPCFSYVYVWFDLEFQCYFWGGGGGWQQSGLMKQRRRTNQMRNNEKWYPPRLSLYWHQSAQTCEFVFERSTPEKTQKKTTHVDMKVQGLQNVARCRCISTTPIIFCHDIAGMQVLPILGCCSPKHPPSSRALQGFFVVSQEVPRKPRRSVRPPANCWPPQLLCCGFWGWLSDWPGMVFGCVWMYPLVI